MKRELVPYPAPEYAIDTRTAQPLVMELEQDADSQIYHEHLSSLLMFEVISHKVRIYFLNKSPSHYDQDIDLPDPDMISLDLHEFFNYF